MELLRLETCNGRELDTILAALPRSNVQAVWVSSDALVYANRTKVAAALHASRLPVVFPWRFVDTNVLMSYGTSLKAAGRKLALYVEKILKGAKPTDLPIEQISNYELVIDLRVARSLGIDLPVDLLQRADEVIR